MYVGIDTYFITAVCDVLLFGRESHLDRVVALLDGYQCRGVLVFHQDTTNLAGFVVLGLRPIT